jgi:hypothetical protein
VIALLDLLAKLGRIQNELLLPRVIQIPARHSKSSA